MTPCACVNADGPAFDRVVDTAGMRSLEAGAPPETSLMRNAAAALAGAIRRKLAPPGSLVALIGPGDNGGDALITAAHLSRAGASAICWASRERSGDPLVKEAVDAGACWKVWSGDSDALRRDVSAAAGVLDGLLGIGSSPPLRGSIKAMLAALPVKPGQPRIAIDIPSGTDADSGAADAHAFQATQTLTTGPVKLGTLLHPAIEFAGEVEALEIGLPADSLARAPMRLIDARTVRALVPERPSGAHKGTFGHLLIVGGSARYRGATALAALAAIASGAGLVTVASVEPAVAAAAAIVPSATFLSLPSDADGHVTATPEDILGRVRAPDALLVGPGLGRSAAIDTLVASLTREHAHAVPTVLDADGLNALAGNPEAIGRLGPSAILTPHPGELARLTGQTTPPAGRARLNAARGLSNGSGPVVVAKGSPTFVCAQGSVWVLARPNPVLATAGTGDVLAGAIAALVAQGRDSRDAARLGVWLHARAAELAAGGVDAGVSGDAIAAALPKARAELRPARRQV